MEFMLLFLEGRGAETSDAAKPARMKEMKEFAAKLASEGKLRRGAPLAPESAGVRVRVREGRAFVADGPFAESKEVLAGFWIVKVASREEAIEIARRCPHARSGTVEVHRTSVRDVVADPGKGTPFLFAFRMEPGLVREDSKLQEMLAFGETLKRGQKFLETAPLSDDPPPARVEPQGRATLVTDGPFAEAKEAVGGYSLVRAADRAEAIEIAKRYPHARWGPVELREVLFFDRV